MERSIDADTPASLLLRVRDHSDETAWEEFVQIYSPIVYEFIRRRSIQASDAADITQEVLLRLARCIKDFQYDSTRGLFRDFVARIVINEIRRQIHKDGRRPHSSDLLDHQVEETQTHSEWNEHFQQAIFQTAMQRCQPHYSDQTWELFQRSWVSDEPIESVIKNTGCSREQVYVARSRVLKRLRQEVSVLADDAIWDSK